MGKEEKVYPCRYNMQFHNADIDECTISTDNCDSNAICTNTIGSFTCACNQGYRGNGVNCNGMNNKKYRSSIMSCYRY